MNKRTFHTLLIDRIKALSQPMEPQETGLQPALSHTLPIRAVLFDIYGTLFISSSDDSVTDGSGRDSELLLSSFLDANFSGLKENTGSRASELLRDFIRAVHHRQKLLGIEYPEVDIRVIWNQTLRQLLMENLLQGNITSQSIDRIAIEYESRHNPIHPMPELQTTMERLHHGGLKLGIVSNAQFYTILAMEAFLGDLWKNDIFKQDLCIWSYEHLEAKPSSGLLRRGLQKLDSHYAISPSETLCVGNDLLKDIAPAAASGCKTALFAGDKRSLRLRHEELCREDLNPDLIVTNLSQIADCLV
jgi:putative hydrolase of the HAD superfamily